MYDSSLLLCSIRTLASFEFCQIYVIAFDESLLKWSTTNNIQFFGVLSTSIDKYLELKCNAASTHSIILLVANIWDEFAIDYLINRLGSYFFLSLKDCTSLLLRWYFVREKVARSVAWLIWESVSNIGMLQLQQTFICTWGLHFFHL